MFSSHLGSVVILEPPYACPIGTWLGKDSVGPVLEGWLKVFSQGPSETHMVLCC